MSTREGNDEIHVVRADGSEPTRITENTVRDGGPAWSPDGSKIAFMTTRDGNTELYVMDSNRANPVNLTKDAPVDGVSWGSYSHRAHPGCSRGANQWIRYDRQWGLAFPLEQAPGTPPFTGVD